MKKPEQIEAGEWLYKGCFIQKPNHHLLSKYVVFKNNKEQTHIDTCHTFIEAKKLCALNECFDNHLSF